MQDKKKKTTSKIPTPPTGKGPHPKKEGTVNKAKEDDTNLKKEIERLKMQLKEKDEQFEKLKKAILYEKAEIENTKKRFLKEQEDLKLFL